MPIQQNLIRADLPFCFHLISTFAAFYFYIATLSNKQLVIWQRHSDILQQTWRRNIIGIYYPPKHLFPVFEIVQFVYVCMCVCVNTTHTKCQLQLSLQSIGLSPQTAGGNVNQKKAHKASIQ